MAPLPEQQLQFTTYRGSDHDDAVRPGVSLVHMEGHLPNSATRVDAVAGKARNAAISLGRCREVGAKMTGIVDVGIDRPRDEVRRHETAYRDLKETAGTQDRRRMSKARR